MPLPNFIIIGAMKSGTSTLHSALKEHPQIGMSKIKETNYFSSRYDDYSIDWYKNQFGTDKSFWGEASPNYTKRHSFADVPERIFKVLPNVKLIYITRDPIERIISHMHHSKFSDAFKFREPNKEALENDKYLLTSSYFFQISEYLKYFNRDQFLFTTTEALRDDYNDVLNLICEFIGARKYNFDLSEKIKHKSENKYFIKNKYWVRRNFKGRIYNYYARVFKYLNWKVKRPILRDETLKILKARIKDDFNQFNEVTKNFEN